MNQKQQRDERVQIKESLKKLLPCKGLESRNAFALVLSFYGNRQQVLTLMQRASHGTRAYIINNDGLPGFLLSQRDHIMNLLKLPDIQAEAKKAINYQQLDFEKLCIQGETNLAVDLKQRSPALYIFALKKLGHEQEIKEYMLSCMKFENDAKNYSFYVHGYWLPTVDQLLAQGKFKKGSKTLNDGSKYQGYLDEKGRAFGYGRASGETKYAGTWLDDKPHGLCFTETHLPQQQWTRRFSDKLQQEFKRGVPFGKGTLWEIRNIFRGLSSGFVNKGTISNMIIDGGVKIFSEDVTNDSKRAFYLEGQHRHEFYVEIRALYALEDNKEEMSALWQSALPKKEQGNTAQNLSKGK